MTRVLLTEYYPLLKALTKVKGAKCKAKLLRQLARDAGFRKCLSEIAANITSEAVPLSLKDKKKLNKQTKVITQLKKSRGVSQSGGFLNIVVPLLATVVAELIANRK